MSGRLTVAVLLVMVFLTIAQTYTWRVWRNPDCNGRPANEVTQQAYCRPMEVGYYGITCNSTFATFTEVCDDNTCKKGCRPPRVYRIGTCYRESDTYSQLYVRCT